MIVVLVRKLGPNWRIITFTSLLYELVPHAIQSTSFVYFAHDSVKSRIGQDSVHVYYFPSKNLFSSSGRSIRHETTYSCTPLQ
jgi:hypothetical protein